jgi:hypothetical protein
MDRRLAQAIAVSSLIIVTMAATVASASQPAAQTSPVTLAQSSRQGQSTANPTIENDDFRFELQGCQRSGTKVKCNLLITNLADVDRTLWFTADYSGSHFSRMIDFSGNEYKATLSQLGQGQGSGSYGEVKLIQGMPMKGILSFEGVPQQVSKLAVLEVAHGFYNRGNVYRNVQFRDVGIIGSN